MSTSAVVGVQPGARSGHRDIGSLVLGVLTVIGAAFWFFPIYWALVTSFRPEDETVKSISPLPLQPTLDGYIYMIQRSSLPVWYLNSTIVSVGVTVLVVAMAACCGYAISQLRFPGRSLLWWIILVVISNYYRNRFNERALLWMNRIAGLAIGAFGIVTLIFSRAR